jgi:hypothetical protein
LPGLGEPCAITLEDKDCATGTYCKGSICAASAYTEAPRCDFDDDCGAGRCKRWSCEAARQIAGDQVCGLKSVSFD